MKTHITFIIIFLFAFTFAQTDTLIKGKISVETNDNDGVNIINLNSKKSAVSFNGGYFKIKAKVNDTLMFSSINMYAKKIILNQRDLKKDLLIVKMEIQQKLIKEIMISSSDRVTAESLGLVPYGQKQYTTAERRLKTASEFTSFNQGLNLSVDALINSISGRTKQLKKELEIEIKEKLQEKILKVFERELFTQKFNIPEEYIDGFMFFIADDENVMNAVKAKNKDLVSFRLTELAIEYIKLKNIVPLKIQKQNNEIQSK